MWSSRRVCALVGCSSSPRKAKTPTLEPRPDTPAGRVPGWVLDVVGGELPVGAFTPITTVETTKTTWNPDGTGRSAVVTAQSHAGASPPEASQVVLDAAGRHTCRRPSADAPCSVFMAYDDAGRSAKLVTAATEYTPEIDWTYAYTAKGTLTGAVQRRGGELVGSMANDASCE